MSGACSGQVSWILDHCVCMHIPICLFHNESFLNMHIYAYTHTHTHTLRYKSHTDTRAILRHTYTADTNTHQGTVAEQWGLYWPDNICVYDVNGQKILLLIPEEGRGSGIWTLSSIHVCLRVCVCGWFCVWVCKCLCIYMWGYVGVCVSICCTCLPFVLC